MNSIKSLIAAAAAAVALTVGLGSFVAPPAGAATATTLDGARTDNYKFCWNYDKTKPEIHTFLSLKSITVGGVVFHHAMAQDKDASGKLQTISYRAAGDGIALKGSDNSTAWLTAGSTSTNLAENWIRFDANGDFGTMIGMKDRDNLKSASIAEALTVSRTKGGTVLGTATGTYQYDQVAANAPAVTNCDANPYQREYNGPRGRWYVGGTFTYFDWDTNHAYPPAAPQPQQPDTTPPTLASVTMPATTTTRTITIQISASDNVKVTEVRFANEDGNWSAWQPYAASKQWTLSSSPAAYKGVSTQVRDAAHNESASIYKRITCNAPCN